MSRVLEVSVRTIGVIAVTLLGCACVSAPQSVREQAAAALTCDASQIAVNRTERHYLGDDAYEAAGCGKKAAYECDRAYVLFIPVGTTACRRNKIDD